MPRRMRGISPVIATVIILAVTIAIAIAVVGWVMGLFRSSTKSSVQLAILPDSYINTTLNATGGTQTLCLHVANKGSTGAQLEKVEISGLGTFDTFNSTTIAAGAKVWIIVGDPDSCSGISGTVLADTAQTITSAVPGVSYDVTIYTADGGVFPGTVLAK